MSTRNWPDPTPEMLNDPRFEAIWQRIKHWDISTDPAGETHRMYSGATGNHVRAILDALDGAVIAQRAAPEGGIIVPPVGNIEIYDNTMPADAPEPGTSEWTPPR